MPPIKPAYYYNAQQAALNAWQVYYKAIDTGANQETLIHLIQNARAAENYQAKMYTRWMNDLQTIEDNPECTCQPNKTILCAACVNLVRKIYNTEF